MPSGRPPIDLTQYREEIAYLYHSGNSISDIIKSLLDNYNIDIKPRTLERRLKEWNIRKLTFTEHSPHLRARIATLFFQCCLNDDEMLQVLLEEGFQIKHRTLQRIRLSMGLHRRLSLDRYEEIDSMLREVVQKELDKGGIEGYGRGLLYIHFRSHMHIISRDRLFSIVRELDPDGVNRRRNDLQRHRGQYIVPGPNFLWSIDGYCKLQRVGIEIYACIDAYSRYIIWIYVGITNKTAVSILRQYLDTLEDHQVQPRKMRSDHGTETPLAAAAHHALRQSLEPEIEFKDCYWFGTSTANQRIESWWGQLSKSLLYQWRSYFQELENEGLFTKENLWDQVAVLAIYIPILREEIHRYARTWNVHLIRKQDNCVTGKPFMLYNYPKEGVTNYGIKPNNDLLCDLQSEFSDFDIDEYLPSTTKAFCTEKLKELGYSCIKQADSQPDGSRTHRHAYLQLRKILEDHIKSGNHPELSQSQKPKGAWQWKNQNFQLSMQKLQESQVQIEEADIYLEGHDELARPEDFHLDFED